MNVVNDIVVINRNRDKALGEVLDASHTTAFAYSENASVMVGDYEDCADAQIIIMTCRTKYQTRKLRRQNDIIGAEYFYKDKILQEMKNV